MAKYKQYDYKQMVMLPISLEDQLSPGTLEFAIHTLVETRMDLSCFDEKYSNDETGRLAYDPKILLKIVLFAYSRGLTGSRRIEQACRENVVFMALTCGEKPDHSTIAAFVTSMKAEIAPLFRDVLLVCEEEGLLAGTFFAFAFQQKNVNTYLRIKFEFCTSRSTLCVQMILELWLSSLSPLQTTSLRQTFQK